MFGSCSEANEILNIQSATKRQRDDNILLYLLFGTTYLKKVALMCIKQLRYGHLRFNCLHILNSI